MTFENLTLVDKKITIVFYAPLGSKIKGFKNGGAEAGCRKTLAVLTKAGFNVIVVEKPVRKSPSLFHGLTLIFDLFSSWLKICRLLKSHESSALHVAGFYLNQVYFEAALIRTAKMLNSYAVYEIRNGGMIEAYESGSATYKAFMKDILTTPDLVFCQGYDYVGFMKNKWNKESVYYPNYVMDDFISNLDDSREKDPSIRLIFVGRVVPDKNVEFILDVCHELSKLNAPFTLDIIGGYESSYSEILNDKINFYKVENRVTLHGAMDIKQIQRHLNRSHFFVFPSKEKREGHSNALTEAMGCGVVPIVSDAGFNRSIADDNSLVIPEFDAIKYAETIYDIWSSGNWKSFSMRAHQRILDNFTEAKVSESLIHGYKLLNKAQKIK